MNNHHNHNSIKKLHEISIQRRLQSGKSLTQENENTPLNLKQEEEKELFLEKLLSSPTRTAPKTAKLIKELDKEIEATKLWRLKEEQNFQNELQKIKNQNENLKKKAENRVMEEQRNFEKWYNYIDNKNTQNIKTYELGIKRATEDYLKERKEIKRKEDDPIFQANLLSDKIDHSEYKLATLGQRNDLNTWGYEMDNFFQNFEKKLKNEDKGDFNNFDSIDKEIYSNDSKYGEYGGRDFKEDRKELDDCLDDIESEFDEIERMMKECGVREDEEGEGDEGYFRSN